MSCLDIIYSVVCGVQQVTADISGPLSSVLNVNSNTNAVTELDEGTASVAESSDHIDLQEVT